jgi:hypothetical protein
MNEELKVNSIISRAEHIADTLLKHLSEKEECNHKIYEIVEEVFGPSFEGQDQYHSSSNQTEEVTT